MKKGCAIGLTLVIVAAAVAFFAGPEIVHRVMKLIYPKPYGEIVSREAAEFDLDENLVYAVMKAESGFHEEAMSHADAHGLMQLTPATFQWIGSKYPPENGGQDILDPNDNIHCGCALLRLLQDRFGNLQTALCAYNAGMGNVAEWLEDEAYSQDGVTLDKIPFPETDAYVERVYGFYATYNKLYAE